MDISSTFLPGTPKSELDTPAFVVDLDAMERNIQKMATYFQGRHAKLRPHMKHHKTPAIAHKQLAAGSVVGVCCQKLGEAEVMVDAGIDNVLVTYEVIGSTKIRRLMSLRRQANVMVTADALDNVKDLSEGAQAFGVSLGVLVDVNSGMNRCGVDLGAPTVELAKAIARSPGLEFMGLHGYEGHLQAVVDLEERTTRAREVMGRLVDLAQTIRKDGLPVPIVTAGGTGTYNITGDFPGVDEVQAGSYVFMDGKYRGVLQDFELAGTVLATVVSRSEPDRAILDSGMKTISTDQWPPQVLGFPGIQVQRPSDEHLTVTLTDSDSRQLRPGDKVEVIPPHNDTTVNLHSHLFGIRNDRLETVWEVAAKGRIR